MEFKVVEREEQKLLKRTQYILLVKHVGQGTPKRFEVRKRVAEMLGVPLDRVYVIKMLSRDGVGETEVKVRVYDTVEDALKVEPDYIIKRNAPPEEKEEGG